MVCFVNLASVQRIIYAIFRRVNQEWKNRTRFRKSHSGRRKSSQLRIREDRRSLACPLLYQVLGPSVPSCSSRCSKAHSERLCFSLFTLPAKWHTSRAVFKWNGQVLLTVRIHPPNVRAHLLRTDFSPATPFFS